MMSNSMQRSNSSAYALHTKHMWTVSTSLRTTVMQNTDRPSVNVIAHIADVLFRVCLSVVLAENSEYACIRSWLCDTLNCSSIPSG